MNHYERLKVAPDAPPEVIRAAYRALAAKLHPDRKGPETRPDDQAHEAMAALNASYLVLMDPSAREQYDQELLRDSRHRASADAVASPMGMPGSSSESHEGPDTRVDIDWLSQTPSSVVPWYQDRRWFAAMVVWLAVMVAGVVWWGLHEFRRIEFDRMLAQRGGGAANEVSAGAAPSAAPDPAQDAELTAAIRLAQGDAQSSETTVATLPPADVAASAADPEALAAMSNDELLALMPRLLDGGEAPANAAPVAVRPTLLNPVGSPHPLDGQPLGLKLAPQLPSGLPGGR